MHTCVTVLVHVFLSFFYFVFLGNVRLGVRLKIGGNTNHVGFCGK